MTPGVLKISGLKGRQTESGIGLNARSKLGASLAAILLMEVREDHLKRSQISSFRPPCALGPTLASTDNGHLVKYGEIVLHQQNEKQSREHGFIGEGK